MLAAFVWWQRRSQRPSAAAAAHPRQSHSRRVADRAVSHHYGHLRRLPACSRTTSKRRSASRRLRTGFAFLPLVIAISLSAGFASARLLARTGPRPLVPTGMLLAAMGMVLSPGDALLGLLRSRDARTRRSRTRARTHLRARDRQRDGGRQRHDAGAASALVNTTQQIGGSIGTALLNTIAVTVASRALASGSASGSRSTAAAICTATQWPFGGRPASLARDDRDACSCSNRARPDERARPPRRELNQRPGVGRPVRRLVGLGVEGVFDEPVGSKLRERELTGLSQWATSPTSPWAKRLDALEQMAFDVQFRRTPR